MTDHHLPVLIFVSIYLMRFDYSVRFDYSIRINFAMKLDRPPSLELFCPITWTKGKILQYWGKKILPTFRLLPSSRPTYSIQLAIEMIPFSPSENPSPSCLQVTILEGRNFKGKDKSGLSDPFVILTVKGDLIQHERRTDILRKTRTPIFNSTFKL